MSHKVHVYHKYPGGFVAAEVEEKPHLYNQWILAEEIFSSCNFQNPEVEYIKDEKHNSSNLPQG